MRSRYPLIVSMRRRQAMLSQSHKKKKKKKNGDGPWMDPAWIDPARMDPSPPVLQDLEEQKRTKYKINGTASQPELYLCRVLSGIILLGIIPQLSGIICKPKCQHPG